MMGFVVTLTNIRIQQHENLSAISYLTLCVGNGVSHVMLNLKHPGKFKKKLYTESVKLENVCKIARDIIWK